MTSTYCQRSKTVRTACAAFGHLAWELLAVSILSLTCAGQSSVDDTCQTLTVKHKQELAAYVGMRYRLNDPELRVVKEEIITGCARRLLFRGGSGVNITLFLAPDQRFLSSKLFDSLKDPVKEQQAEVESVGKSLKGQYSPRWGGGEASTTIAVFSDFECPYCKEFADTLNTEVLPTAAGRISVVFHYLPLPMHPWAKEAAMRAACINEQSTGIFWLVHNAIFAKQEELNRKLVSDLVFEQLRLHNELSAEKFNKCLEEGIGAKRVSQDEDLAAELNITQTPTVFVNGRKLSGALSAERLKTIVNEAGNKR